MTGNDAQFARHIGVNKSTVCRARKAGRLVLTASGLVDFEASIARLNETAGGRTDVAARHAANRGAAIPTNGQEQKNATARNDASASGLDDQPSAGETTRTGAKVALLHYENASIKLEMALRRGLRIERGAMKREAHGLGAMLRAGIERVIDQTAPRLAAAGTDAERQRILEREIRRLAWIIKREMPRALRRMRDAGRAKEASA